MGVRSIAPGAAVLVIVAALSGCGSDHTSGRPPSSAVSSSGQAAATTSNPYGAPSIDPPAADEPVLTVTGGPEPLALTMDQLNALGSVTITVDEPFVKKRETFTGVPLAAVLAKAGIADSATIDTVALNAYHYTTAVRSMLASEALIATRRGDAPIPYDQGGPIRIVFPDGTPLSSVLDAWNWSLASIAVTPPPAGSS